jgi:archaellum component FlaG (FlaF/FlaG flagellin family)
MCGRKQQIALPGAVLALLAITAGCGDSKFEFASVKGRVLLDGQAVPNARVVYMPQTRNEDGEAGPYSGGKTDANGHYSLSTTDETSRPGAVVGAHRIVISTKRAHRHPTELDVEVIDSPETIPAVYTNYRLTPLTFDVPVGGTTSADFSLESQAK